jgi:transposase
MSMLSDRIDAVIGVDTHTDTHTGVIVNAAGGKLFELTVPSTEEGYGQLLDALLTHAPGWRVAWAIEGTASYGAALSDLLHADGAEVLEIPTARRARGRGKNDTNDALAIARAALSQAIHAVPRTGEIREALRLLTITRSLNVKNRTRLTNLLKALVLKLDDPTRARFRAQSTPVQLAVAARLRVPTGAGVATGTRLRAIKDTAAQISDLTKKITTADKQLDQLTQTHAAPLRALFGIGPVSAAQILITFSHPGRFRSAAAFAAIAGTSPLEASSGRTIRHRLNRTGDRQLNAALHRVILTRRRADGDPETHTYIVTRTALGKSPKEAERMLKNYLARRLYRLLEIMPAMP